MFLVVSIFENFDISNRAIRFGPLHAVKGFPEGAPKVVFLSQALDPTSQILGVDSERTKTKLHAIKIVRFEIAAIRIASEPRTMIPDV